jgi:DMSO/TMAO reductase YedYZ molybdopterin-dependent catalytic subunit
VRLACSPTRRIYARFGLRLTAGLASLLLSGCGDEVSDRPWVRQLLAKAEDLNYWLQRQVLPHDALAREYSEADLSPQFRANGSTDPDDEDYRRLAANDFADWRLEVGGLVERPERFSLADLRALPSRTQITRHDCVEGWSCIGKVDWDTARGAASACGRAARGAFRDVPLRRQYGG